MKKILSMLAFVAAIVMGAFTLASCGDDDDDPVVVKHNFTFAVIIDSQIPSTADIPEFKEKRKSLEKEYMSKLTYFEATEEEAAENWDKIVEKLTPQAFADVNDLCTSFDDELIFIKLEIHKDGLPWKAMTWDLKQAILY